MRTFAFAPVRVEIALEIGVAGIRLVAIALRTAMLVIVRNAQSTPAIALSGSAPGGDALAPLAALAAAARVIALPTMLVVELGVDAGGPALMAAGAAAAAVDASQGILAGVVALAAMLVVVARVDAPPVAEDLAAGAAAVNLAFPVDAGDIDPAGAIAPPTVPGIGPRVDAVLAALDRAFLARLRLLLALLSSLDDGRPDGASEAEAEEGRGQPAAGERQRELLREAVEARPVHDNPLAADETGVPEEREDDRASPREERTVALGAHYRRRDAFAIRNKPHRRRGCRVKMAMKPDIARLLSAICIAGVRLAGGFRGASFLGVEMRPSAA